VRQCNALFVASLGDAQTYKPGAARAVCRSMSLWSGRARHPGYGCEWNTGQIRRTARLIGQLI